jgi:hypothetical protein
MGNLRYFSVPETTGFFNVQGPKQYHSGPKFSVSSNTVWVYSAVSIEHAILALILFVVRKSQLVPVCLLSQKIYESKEQAVSGLFISNSLKEA